jgi:hypothetical protein
MIEPTHPTPSGEIKPLCGLCCQDKPLIDLAQWNALRELLKVSHDHYEGQNECSICDEPFGKSGSGKTHQSAKRTRPTPHFRHRKESREKQSKHAGDWFEKMPGHWPFEMQVTMEDCRAARAFLEKYK